MTLIHFKKMRIIRLAQVLLLLAMGLAGWLTMESVNASVGCSQGGDCSSVVTSPWSKLLGVPVALLGAFSYLALLILTFARPLQSRLVCAVCTTLCLVILGSAFWFTALQAVIIKSFCPYCCGIHALAVVAALLLLTQLFKGYRGEGSPAIVLPMALGFSTVAGMVAIQFYAPTPQQSIVVSTSYHQHGAQSTPQLFTTDPLQFAGGEIAPRNQLETMRIGSGEGEPTPLVFLYDWTCEYCVAFHQKLSELSHSPTVEGVYEITLLPHYHTEEAQGIHLALATLKMQAPAEYENVKLELYYQALPNNLASIKSRVEEATSTISRSVTIDLSEAFKLALAQFRYNQEALHLQSVPQLFSPTSALNGNPTEEEILTFLKTSSTLEQ